MISCADCGRVHDPDRPNVAHYWRRTPRHHWRLSSTTVNASPCAVPSVRLVDGIVYADVPYDWEVWRPAQSARTLPGITPAMLAMIGEIAHV